MNFPKFPSYYKQHMPFIGEINGKPEYLICFAEFNSTIWKIYRYNNKFGWIRLTNSNSNVIECNPSVYQKNNNIIYSWIIQDEDNSKGIIKQIDLNEYNKNFSMKKFFDYNNIESNLLFGVYAYDKYITRKEIMEKLNLQKVLHLQIYKYPEIIISYIENNIKKSMIYNLITKQKYRITCDNGEIYKPCFYKGNWFSVITLKGNNLENRFVIKNKNIKIEELV